MTISGLVNSDYILWPLRGRCLRMAQWISVLNLRHAPLMISEKELREQHQGLSSLNLLDIIQDWYCTWYRYQALITWLEIVKRGLFFFFVFLGLHSWHMEVPRLGVQLELWPPAYARATAMQDLSLVCNLHYSSWQCWILNSVKEARDWTHVLMDASWVC